MDWNSRESLDQITNGEKLFIFNHFFGVRALSQTLHPNTEVLFNTKEFIQKRLEVKCDPGTNYKIPNYIVLDFVTSSTYKEVVQPYNDY